MSWPPVATLVLALSAGGCDAIKAITGGVAAGTGSPVVRATSGGSAMLTIIACPRSTTGGEMWREFLEMMIQSSSVIVTAADGAQARLILNACPFPLDVPVTTERRIK